MCIERLCEWLYYWCIECVLRKDLNGALRRVVSLLPIREIVIGPGKDVRGGGC